MWLVYCSLYRILQFSDTHNFVVEELLCFIFTICRFVVSVFKLLFSYKLVFQADLFKCYKIWRLSYVFLDHVCS